MKLHELKEAADFGSVDKDISYDDMPKDENGFLSEKKDITQWLCEHSAHILGPHSFKVDSEGYVSCFSDVKFKGQSFTKLPIKFSRLDSLEIVNHLVEIESLDGLPDEMENLHIAMSQLKSLKGCPIDIKGSLILRNCQLESLDGCAATVGADFDCTRNKLKNLVGGPKAVYNNYSCCQNALSSLEGAPEKMTFGYFDCTGNNMLRNLTHAPKRNCGFTTSSYYLTDLTGIADIFETIDSELIMDFRCVTKGGLGLLNIQGLRNIANSDAKLPDPFKIIDKYLDIPDSLFDCQAALIDAGFEKFAQL